MRRPLLQGGGCSAAPTCHPLPEVSSAQPHPPEACSPRDPPPQHQLRAAASSAVPQLHQPRAREAACLEQPPPPPPHLAQDSSVDQLQLLQHLQGASSAPPHPRLPPAAWEVSSELNLPLQVSLARRHRPEVSLAAHLPQPLQEHSAHRQHRLQPRCLGAVVSAAVVSAAVSSRPPGRCRRPTGPLPQL